MARALKRAAAQAAMSQQAFLRAPVAPQLSVSALSFPSCFMLSTR
jgi:hypothetical protein